jgi:hypothetical protein
MDPSVILLVLIVVGAIVIANRSRSLKQKNIGAPPPDLWRDYRSALDGYEQALRGLSYQDLVAVMATKGRAAGSSRSFGLPAQSLSVNQIETLLHVDGKPHGYQLIEPAALPVFPSLPLQPPADQPLPLWRRIFWAPPKSSLSPIERQAQVERASKLQGESEALRRNFATRANRWVTVKRGCKAGEPEAIKLLMRLRIRHTRCRSRCNPT